MNTKDKLTQPGFGLDTTRKHKQDFGQQSYGSKPSNPAGDVSEPLEKAILGHLLLDNSIALDLDLAPYMFNVWGKVAEEVWLQLDRDGGTNAQALAFECGKKGICPKEEVFALVANADGDPKQHATKLREEWLRGQMSSILEDAASKLAAGEGVEEVMALLDAERDVVTGFADDKNQTRVQQANGFLDAVIKAKKGEEPSYYTTGNVYYDRMIGGVGVPGRFTVQGARPGMAKTTRALQMAFAAAADGCPTLFISLEMDFHELMAKYVQSQTGIDNADIQEGKITDSELTKIHDCVAQFYDLPIYIEDEPMPWSKMKSRIRQYCKKYGVKLVVIDYLQLIKGDERAQNRNLEVAGVTRDMLLLCKSAKCQIWALAQLSRDVEKRGGLKKPMLSDLRDSGSIEQDAGQIIFNWRPEYYGILEDEEGESLVGVLDNIVEKNRYVRRRGPVREYYDYSRDMYLPDRPGEQPEPQPAYAGATMPAAGDDEPIPF